MSNGIRTGNPRGFKKGRSSKFPQDSRVQQTPEDGQKTYWLKRCGNNNEDEDNSPKTLNDKNHQALSQKFSQLRNVLFCLGWVGFISTIVGYLTGYFSAYTLNIWFVNTFLDYIFKWSRAHPFSQVSQVYD